MLFAKSIHGGEDLSLIKGYEFRDNKVYFLTKDGSPGENIFTRNANKPDTLAVESAFIEAIQGGDLQLSISKH